MHKDFILLVADCAGHKEKQTKINKYYRAFQNVFHFDSHANPHKHTYTNTTHTQAHTSICISHTYTYQHTHIHISAYTHQHMHITHTHISIHIHISAYTHQHMHISAYTHQHTHISIHIHTSAYTYARTPAYTHKHTHRELYKCQRSALSAARCVCVLSAAVLLTLRVVNRSIVSVLIRAQAGLVRSYTHTPARVARSSWVPVGLRRGTVENVFGNMCLSVCVRDGARTQ